MKVNLPIAPLVSIVVPTYQRAHLVAETIRSVINQTYGHWELIVVDDGSRDDTEAVVTGFKDSRIRYIAIDHTGSTGSVRNAGIKLALGEYIAFLDSDDLWRPDKLTFQLNLCLKYPQASFIFGNGTQFGEGAITPPDWEDVFAGNFFEAMVFQKKFCIYTSTFIFKKEVMERIGPLKDELIIDSEVDFLYRATYLFKGIFTNERLISIRKHSQNTSSTVSFRTYTELIDIYKAFYDEQWITKGQYNHLAGTLYYTMALDLYRKGRSKSAFATFIKSIRLVPMNWKGWARLAQVSPLALGSDE